MAEEVTHFFFFSVFQKGAHSPCEGQPSSCGNPHAHPLNPEVATLRKWVDKELSRFYDTSVVVGSHNADPGVRLLGLSGLMLVSSIYTLVLGCSCSCFPLTSCAH